MRDLSSYYAPFGELPVFTVGGPCSCQPETYLIFLQSFTCSRNHHCALTAHSSRGSRAIGSVADASAGALTYRPDKSHSIALHMLNEARIVLNGKERLHPAVDIPRHQVGRPEIDLLLAAIAEIVDAAVLQKTARRCWSPGCSR